MKENKIKTDIREYEEEMDVEIERYCGRLVVKSYNEGGHNMTRTDLLDILRFVKNNLPSLFEKV